MEWLNNQEEKSPQTETGTGQSAGEHCFSGSSVHRTVNKTNPNVSLEDLESQNALSCSSDISPGLLDSWTQDFSYDQVKKSKSYDCVKQIGPSYSAGPENRAQAWALATCHHSRVVTSASFPGRIATPRLLLGDQNTHTNKQEMIDYRNLTPQVPFVPSIAKSIPKKRIFLRKPKKVIKDLFVHKKQNNERATSPCTPCHDYKPTKKQSKKSLKYCEFKTSRKMNDSLSDSSSDGCVNTYDDAVSLKSFDSQAGCGEIFADEEYLVSLEGMANLKTSRDSSEPTKQSPSAPQGGMEQLASPSHPEVLDLFGMWETIHKTINFNESSGQETNNTSTPISISSSSIKMAYPTESITSKNMPKQENNVNHTVTPKSENQESTSDEGYCDNISTEDHTAQSLTPVFSRKFPRDTYSGDALYELFYDPSEAEMTPIFDDEMDLPSNIIGLPSPDLPLSMYSFHVGSEENLAPPLSVDLISHDFLQSNWIGKDCLLKLCDTEMSLAMGIVNWMKQKVIMGNQTDAGNPGISTGDNPDLNRQNDQTTDRGYALSKERLRTGHSEANETGLKLSKPSQVDAGHLSVGTVNHHDGVVTTPENEAGTPTSHVCLRMFTINSPSTPSKNLQSPVGHSPGYGSSSLFVLAINKESLCESCSGSLKQGAKELHLCHSCSSFIKKLKTSELWPHASLYQAKLAGTPQALLPSPSSSCGIASDISILSLVEQCANQMASLKFNQDRNPLNHETRGIANQGGENYSRKDSTRKYIKSKRKKKEKVSNITNVKDSLNHIACSVNHATTYGSDDSVLDSHKTPCYLQTKPSKVTDVSHTSRPTSLPLTSANSSRSFKQNSGIKIKEKSCKRSRLDRKPVSTKEVLSSNITEEKKLEQRCRIKK